MNRLAFLILILAEVVHGGEPPPLEELTSKDITKQIIALVAIAEKGKDANAVELQIAALLTKTQRGRWLARWCFYALDSIGADTLKYVESFRDAALWKPARANPPFHHDSITQDIIGVGGAVAPDSAEIAEPEYPIEIKAKSEQAWRGCARPLVAIYISREPQRAWDAQVCLQHMGMPAEVAVAVLCIAVKDEKLKSTERAAAAKLVGFFGPSKQASDCLLKAIEDANVQIRSEAASSLGRLREHYSEISRARNPPPHPDREKAVQALIKALSDAESDVRISAAIGLGYMVDEAKEALEPLKTALEKEADKKVQTWLKQSIRYVENGTRWQRVGD